MFSPEDQSQTPGLINRPPSRSRFSGVPLQRPLLAVSETLFLASLMMGCSPTSSSRPGITPEFASASTSPPLTTLTPRGVDIGQELFRLPTPDRSSLSTPEISPNRQIVNQAERGDTIILSPAHVEYLVRFPWLRGSAYWAVLSDTQGGSTRFLTFVENADCIFRELQTTDRLGNPLQVDSSVPVGGFWQPSVAFEEIQAQVMIESAVGTVPTLTAAEITDQGQTLACPLERDISEQEVEIGARTAGRLFKDIITGFRQGFFED